MAELINRGGGNRGSIGEMELVHMLYEAVADNSLWPEMISEVMEHIELTAASQSGGSTRQFDGLVKHFERAMRLSEDIVSHQERNSTLEGVLDSLAFGISVYDRSGKQLYANALAHSSSHNRLRIESEAQAIAMGLQPASKSLPTLTHNADTLTDVAIIPVDSIKKTRLPANAETLVITLPALPEHTLDHIRRSYYLTETEGDLLAALHKFKHLRKSAAEISVTYESARTYLKRIYAKTGCDSQASLLALLERSPMSLIQHVEMIRPAKNPVRHNLVLPDGRNLEYFALGARDAQPVLHFDALTGVALDLLGAPEIYRPILDKLGLQIIVPCRPGTFRSEYRKMDGLGNFTPDLLFLMEHLDLKKATLLSQAFGSCSALAFAATAPERVERLVLCAPSYPRYEPPDWRKMDLFYIISGVIGRRAPALLKAIVPFLMRSVMQNTAKYLERHIARSNCPADVAVLSSPTLQRRIPEMLAARTALGTSGLVQENFLNTHGWNFDLTAVTMPVHILQGELDNVSHPEGGRKLAAALPDARYHSFPDLGQYLIFSQWPWILEMCAGTEIENLAEIPMQPGRGLDAAS